MLLLNCHVYISVSFIHFKTINTVLGLSEQKIFVFPKRLSDLTWIIGLFTVLEVITNKTITFNLTIFAIESPVT